MNMRDAEDMDAGRAAGAHTSVERGALSRCRQEQRRKKRDSGQRGAPDDDGGLAGGEALDAATAGSDDSTDTLIAGGGVADTRASLAHTLEAKPPCKKQARATPRAAAAAEVRILELEKELVEQKNRALAAELSAMRATGSGPAPPAAAVNSSGGAAGPPAWLAG